MRRPTTTVASSSPVSVSSARSATTSRPPGPTSSRATPASARSPSSTPTPYEAKLAGEVRDFTAVRLDGPQGRPPQRVEPALRRRRGQAGARRLGLRADRREPDRGRGRLRLRRRWPGADDRQLQRAPRTRPPDRRPDVHRQRPRRQLLGDDRHRDRRHRPQRLHGVGLRDRHAQRRRGRRGDPSRRLHRRHHRLDRGARCSRSATPASRTCAAWACPDPARRPRDRLAAVRRHARRVRARRGRRLAVPRGPRARQGARRADLRRGRGLRLRGRRLGHDPADRGRRRLGAGDADGPRPTRRPGRRGRPHQPARHLDAARRQARGGGDLDGLRRALGRVRASRSRSARRSR